MVRATLDIKEFRHEKAMFSATDRYWIVHNSLSFVLSHFVYAKGSSITFCLTLKMEEILHLYSLPFPDPTLCDYTGYAVVVGVADKL